jgi:hypothetical protein
MTWLTEQVQSITVSWTSTNRHASASNVGSKHRPPPNKDGSNCFGLTDRGLCVPEKAAGVLSWPAIVTPVNNETPWPIPLLLAELTLPPDRFAAIDCRISHVKVTVAPDHRMTAKAYLWFAHTLLAPAK